MTALIDEGFPFVVAGDFNCIDGLEEMGGWPFVEDTGSREFDEFLHSNG